MITRATVFCGSSSLSAPHFQEATIKLAKQLVKENILVQYGGGEIGLMGRLADTVIEEGGKIRGVIPHFMVEEGWVHPGVADMKVVTDMAERKRLLITETDVIIALPGGFGTLEELSEAITLKQLGLISVPVLILNIDKFYDPLFDFFNRMVQNNFIRKQHNETWTVLNRPEEIISAIHASKTWDTGNARATAAL